MPGDYSMMETSSMLPFDSRTTTSAPLQRPIMAPQYMVTAPYTSAPMTSLTTTHYQAPNPYQFGGYHSPPSPPHLSPFKQEYSERRVSTTESDNGRGLSYRDVKHVHEEQAHSPSARSESQVSTARSVSSNPSLQSKTITSNETINPDDQVTFDTEVDELMKAIQKKAEKGDSTSVQQTPTPGMSPASETGIDQAPEGRPLAPSPGEAKASASKKRHVCNGPNCNKSFTQKTHLDIHRRTHTGDKPYTCSFADCNLTFSQLGNLKTHMRRHTGERPYACGKCGRRFAQRGNVRAHEQTHQGLKPFICKLDDCNKTFSQLGNMKTHQNNFHKQALKSLTSKFAQILKSGDQVPETDKDLFEYFATHYKNSNKGIKGRGKARTVADRRSRSASHSPVGTPVTAQYALPPPPQQQPASPQHMQQQSHPQPHGLSHPGSLAAYSMSRGPSNMVNTLHREGHQQGGYEMFEMDSEHNSVQSSSNSPMMYEEDQARQMAFSERMY